jgi:hypothetical protein
LSKLCDVDSSVYVSRLLAHRVTYNPSNRPIWQHKAILQPSGLPIHQSDVMAHPFPVAIMHRPKPARIPPDLTSCESGQFQELVVGEVFREAIDSCSRHDPHRRKRDLSHSTIVIPHANPVCRPRPQMLQRLPQCQLHRRPPTHLRLKAQILLLQHRQHHRLILRFSKRATSRTHILRRGDMRVAQADLLEHILQPIRRKYVQVIPTQQRRILSDQKRFPDLLELVRLDVFIPFTQNVDQLSIHQQSWVLFLQLRKQRAKKIKKQLFLDDAVGH